MSESLLLKNQIVQTSAPNSKELASLWIKHEKKLILDGVCVADTIVRDEPTKSIQTGKAWQTVFDPKQFDEDEAKAFLQSIGNIGEYSNPEPPDIWTYFKVTKTNKNTLPGPNGLPYAAYNNKHALEALLETDIELRNIAAAPVGGHAAAKGTTCPHPVDQ